MDLDGDGISTWGDRYAFNYWLELGGSLGDALSEGRPEGEVVDLSDFFLSPRAALSRDAALISLRLTGKSRSGSADSGVKENRTAAQLYPALQVQDAKQVYVIYDDADYPLEEPLLSVPLGGHALIGGTIYVARREEQPGISRFLGFDVSGDGSVPLSLAERQDFFSGQDDFYELAADATHGSPSLLATAWTRGTVVRFMNLGDSSQQCLEVPEGSVASADGIAVLGDASYPNFGLRGAIFVCSNREYTGMNDWGAMYRDNQTASDCNPALPELIIRYLNYPPAVALGDIDAGGGENGPEPFALYYGNRYYDPGNNTWKTKILRVENPPNWNASEEFVTVTGVLSTLAIDPYSDSLFIGSLGAVLRVNPQGEVANFLMDLTGSGGGLTFTWSGILVVSELGRLLGVDGWRYRFKRGDANADLRVNISDADFILNWLFKGGPEADCWDTADINDDARINISDPIYLLQHLFYGGPEPPPPYEDFGVDPSPDLFGCRKYDPAQEIPWPGA